MEQTLNPILQQTQPYNLLKLQYGEIFDSAWKALKDDLALVAGLSLVYGFAVWVVCLIPFLGQLLTGPMAMGYMRCLIQIRAKQVIGYEDFFWGFINLNRLLHAVLLSAIVFLGTALGFILLIIPGIWFLVSSVFSNPLFLLEKQDAIEAIKKSFDLSKGRWLNIFGFMVCIGMLNIAGALCFVIGLLVSAPITTMAIILATEKLRGLTPAADATSPAFTATANAAETPNTGLPQ